MAGADSDARRYLEVLGSNLNATLDIGETRSVLRSVAKGLIAPRGYFKLLEAWDDDLGSHRNAGKRRVSVLDDHDHVSGDDKVRFSSDAIPADYQVVAGVALQLFGLGIPCIYYGTEQAFAGPEKSQRDQYLPDYNAVPPGGQTKPDKFLREAMFGPEHPRLPGAAGIGAGAANFDPAFPGFGPFGTCGAHCFNEKSPAFLRIAALARGRRRYPLLRYGRQYQRSISNFNLPFAFPAPGELIAWSRILDDEEALCIVNGNGSFPRGGDVLVDPRLNAASAPANPWGAAGPFFRVIANSAQAAVGAAYSGPYPLGADLPVRSRGGDLFIEIRDLPPSEVLVLINRP